MLHYNIYRLLSRRVRVGYLYDYLFSYSETSTPMKNIQTEEQMNAFIIDLRSARFMYCSTLVIAFSFCEAFLHKEATWS